MNEFEENIFENIIDKDEKEIEEEESTEMETDSSESYCSSDRGSSDDEEHQDVQNEPDAEVEMQSTDKILHQDEGRLKLEEELVDLKNKNKKIEAEMKIMENLLKEKEALLVEKEEKIIEFQKKIENAYKDNNEDTSIKKKVEDLEKSLKNTVEENENLKTCLIAKDELIAELRNNLKELNEENTNLLNKEMEKAVALATSSLEEKKNENTPALAPAKKQLAGEKRTRSLIKGIKQRDRPQKKDDPDFQYEKVYKRAETKTKKQKGDIEKGIKLLQKFKRTLTWKLLKEEDLAILKYIIEHETVFANVWTHEYCFISVRDLWELIHDQDTGDNIIDAYFLILLEMKNKTDASSSSNSQNTKTMILSSVALQYVLKKMDEGAKALIDNKLKSTEVKDCRYIIFPINYDNHWTLLVLDTEDGLWRHYNSLLPKEVTEDTHLKKSKIMIEYVRKNVFTDVIQSTPENIIQELETPQQTSGTRECGIYCMMVATDIINGNIIPKEYPPKATHHFRANLFSMFLNDTRTWTDKVPNQ